VFEFHVGEFRGHLQHRLHVAERGGEDDLVALRGQVADHAFGIGALGHLLDDGGLDLVAELGFHFLAAQVVRIRPARVTGRPDVDEGDLQRLGLGGGRGDRSRLGRRRRGCGRRLFLLAAAHQRGGSQGGQCGGLQQRALALDDHDHSSV